MRHTRMYYMTAMLDFCRILEQPYFVCVLALYVEFFSFGQNALGWERPVTSAQFASRRVKQY